MISSALQMQIVLSLLLSVVCLLSPSRHHQATKLFTFDVSSRRSFWILPTVVCSHLRAPLVVYCHKLRQSSRSASYLQVFSAWTRNDRLLVLQAVAAAQTEQDPQVVAVPYGYYW